MRFSKLLLVSAFLLSTVSAFALTIPEKPAAYVNDYASLLSSEARQKIEGILAAFEKETSNQVVVAIFPSLDGQVLEDFSIKLAETWKIGDKKNDNGVILLVFKEDRAMRIEVGYGLEGALPDALAGQIIRSEITPSFKEGDFDAGILKGVNAIILATRGEYKATAESVDPFDEYAPGVFLGLFFYFLLPIVCYAFIVFICFAGLGLPGILLAAVLVALLEFLRRAFFSSYIGKTFSSRGGGGGFGGSSFGGGGFGGGGGSFGGGGASGRW